MHRCLRGPCATHALAIALLAAATAVPAAGVTVTALDKDGQPLANAVVYARPVNGVAPMGAPAAVRVAQQGMEFVPYVTVLRVGSSADFPNLDPRTHHVRSFSPAKEFNFFLSPGKGGATVVFDTPGAVVVYCMLHDWMRSYIYVVDTPWFAKSDESGIVSLTDLPEGSYRLAAWHPDFGHMLPALEQALSLGKDQNAAVRFQFPFKPKKPRGPRGRARRRR
jgi:plastocyanin